MQAGHGAAAGDKWMYEIKFDGYRCIAVKRRGEVTLFSRYEKMLNKRFPTVVDALASLQDDFVLDGEVMAFGPRGKPSFQLIQKTDSQKVSIYCYFSDVLHRRGELVVGLPLTRRRELLESLLTDFKDPVRLSPLLRGTTWQIVEAVRKLSLEGIVGKQIDSVYETDERSGAWIKLRSNLEQEFVVGGYIPGARGFDALLVGVYEKNELIFVREGEGRLRSADSGRDLPDTQGAANCPVSLQESA